MSDNAHTLPSQDLEPPGRGGWRAPSFYEKFEQIITLVLDVAIALIITLTLFPLTRAVFVQRVASDRRDRAGSQTGPDRIRQGARESCGFVRCTSCLGAGLLAVVRAA